MRADWPVIFSHTGVYGAGPRNIASPIEKSLDGSRHHGFEQAPANRNRFFRSSMQANELWLRISVHG